MSIGTNTPRLLAAAKEFNIGKDTLAEYLIEKDFVIETSKPNTKLTPEMYNALQKEFGQNKGGKRKSDEITLPTITRKMEYIEKDDYIHNFQEDEKVISKSSSTSSIESYFFKSIGTNTPRLLAAAKEFNIGKDSLVEYLNRKGFVIDTSKPNMKLTSEMYNSLRDQYTQDKAVNTKGNEINLSKIDGKAEAFKNFKDIDKSQKEELETSIIQNIEKIEEHSLKEWKKVISEIEKDKAIKNEFEKQKLEENLSTQFKINNPFQSSIDAILYQKNIFEDRNAIDVYFEDKTTSSIFSDFEAFSICLGLTNNHAHTIARKYFDNPKNLTNKIEAHELAMKTLEKYGPHLISSIINIPPLPFQAIDASQVFSELDNRLKSNKSPNIRIRLKGVEGENEIIIVSFYKEDKKDWKVRTNEYISVRRIDDFIPTMTISRSGVIKVKENSTRIIPILQLFIRFSKDTKQMILNYGLETGECSICGRKLTDSTSIRLGIGPKCGGRK